MSALQGVAIVAAGLLGIAVLVSGVPVLRRPRLDARLDDYLGALGPRRSALLVAEAGSARGVAALFEPLLRELGERLQRFLGEGGDHVSARLAAADLDLREADFRARQVAWGLAGFGIALSGALALASAGRPVSLPAALVAAAAFGVGGVLARDRSLTRAVERRRGAIVAEFPTFVDLVCLAVTAGESLRGALELVAERGTGPLAHELRAVLRESRAGRPLAEALEVRAHRVGVPALERFVGAVLAAQERGIPLADTLRAMSFEVREGEKRSVIEAGGRKQISMLIPVVALILPVAIVFAFYPGMVAIRTLSH